MKSNYWDLSSSACYCYYNLLHNNTTPFQYDFYLEINRILLIGFNINTSFSVFVYYYFIYFDVYLTFYRNIYDSFRNVIFLNQSKSPFSYSCFFDENQLAQNICLEIKLIIRLQIITFLHYTYTTLRCVLFKRN